MSYFDYEYFCGANVVIEIGGQEALEAVAISYSEQNSRRPIYGYSSKFFDAIAEGQVLVQGSLVINYIHQDYLYRLLQGYQRTLVNTSVNFKQVSNIPDAELRRYNITPNLNSSNAKVPMTQNVKASMNDLNNKSSTGIGTDKPSQLETNALKQKYWNQQDLINDTYALTPASPAFNASDVVTPVHIKITFGERSAENQHNGITGLLLTNLFFTGRGIPIQIDENVIVEEYPFFARNIESLTNVPKTRIEPTIIDNNGQKEIGATIKSY